MFNRVVVECTFWKFVKIEVETFVQLQGAARLLADLNLAPSALKWWEKGGVGITAKGTSQSFVSPNVSDCHALVEGGTSVRRGSLLF